MPIGRNRTDLNNGGVNYRNGTPITLPHTFGNVVTTIPANNDNQIPTNTKEQNIVSWTPSPTHFGNVNP